MSFLKLLQNTRYLLSIFLTAQMVLLISFNSENIDVVAQQPTMAATPYDSFNVKGTINSLDVSDVLGSNTSDTSANSNVSGDIFIYGGNWSFAVADGNVTDFKVALEMVMINGTGFHTHSIDGIRNVSGDWTFNNTEPIKITLNRNNYTDFGGIVDISTNGTVEWRDVPIAVHLLNGKVINFNIDPVVDHFKGLPIYGLIPNTKK